jgi:hypothetical protein
MALIVSENYYKLFEEAPVAAAILDASDLKLEMVNPGMLELLHRPSSVKGMCLLEFLPEFREQEYPQLLEKVIKTGQIHKEIGARVILNRHIQQESVFMDYSYTPITGNGNSTTAILVMATDVCEREMNKLNMLQSRRDLRALVMSSPVAMCIYRDADYTLDAVNDLMKDLWQGNPQKNMTILNHVYHNGIPYKYAQNGITYSYTPLRNWAKEVNAVCVIAVRTDTTDILDCLH